MGFHAPHILVAVDEATGIDREIMDALTGNLTGVDAQIVMICNPIDKDSVPYEAEQSGEWKVIHISALEHPNVQNGTNEIRGAVTREWIEDRVRSWSMEVNLEVPDALLAESERAFELPWSGKYYRKTALAQARILGEWAQLDEIGFIPMELIEDHIWHTYTPSGVTLRAMGVDISRGLGKDATVYSTFDVREDGPDIQTGFHTILDEDLMATADRIKEKYDDAKSQGIELVIAIDDTGVGGGVSDRLKRLDVPFYAINFNNRARGFFPGKEIANARAEMYFVLRQELLDGSILLKNFKRFHQELSSVRLALARHGTAYKMEDKDLTKQRLGRSPDYADATALARYGLSLKRSLKTAHLL